MHIVEHIPVPPRIARKWQKRLPANSVNAELNQVAAKVKDNFGDTAIWLTAYAGFVLFKISERSKQKNPLPLRPNLRDMPPLT